MALPWSRHPRNAAAWFARRLRGADMTGEANTQFRRWLASDPRNAGRYEQQELIWKVSGKLEHDPEIKALVEGIETGSQAVRARSTAGKPMRFALATVACAVALVAVGLIVALTRGGTREAFYATHVGEERTIVLPDHSAITLNTATRVRISYGRSHRTVVLEQGEATFSVAHDLARPFEVTASGGTARALATQFNVLANGNRITVAVLEGRVAVSAAQTPGTASTLVVSGGEQITYAGSKLDRPEPANIARIRGWHAGRIVLNDVELGEAIVELNRYSPLPLRLGNPSLEAHRITGVFHSGETDAFLAALEEAFDVKVERTSTAITLQ